MSTNRSATVRVVPWQNSRLFIKVYEYLFNDDILKKKWALDEITVWELKSHPCLPSGIEATFLLTSAVVHDILWTNERTFIQPIDLQALYGSAITRFVSLAVDNNKNKNPFSYFSAAQLAKLHGIDSFIIDLRNEWCHSRRPSVQVLRPAAQLALNYMEQSYWEKEVAQERSYMKQPPDEKKLISLFEDYVDFSQDILKGLRFKGCRSANGRFELDREYKNIMRNLGKHLKKNAEFFVNVLVSGDIFIPTDQAVRDMVSEEDYKLLSIEPYFKNEDTDEDENMEVDNIASSLEFEEHNFPSIPKYHEALWLPIIKLLNKYDAVPVFMEALLSSQGDRTVVGQKLLISWILNILQIHNIYFTLRNRKLKKVFRNKSVIQNWERLFYSAMINPCKYAMVIMPLILFNVDLKEHVRHHIIGLLAVNLGLACSKMENEKTLQVYTLQDLKLALQNKRKPETENLSNRIWFVSKDECHNLWPLGQIINRLDGFKVEEKVESIFDSIPKLEDDIHKHMFSSNKNEDEKDDDLTSNTIKQPDLNKMLIEIEKKPSAMLRRSD